jgi:hypothetical protein
MTKNKRHPQYLSRRLRDLRRARAIERAWDNYLAATAKIPDTSPCVHLINLN